MKSKSKAPKRKVFKLNPKADGLAESIGITTERRHELSKYTRGLMTNGKKCCENVVEISKFAQSDEELFWVSLAYGRLLEARDNEERIQACDLFRDILSPPRPKKSWFDEAVSPTAFVAFAAFAILMIVQICEILAK